MSQTKVLEKIKTHILSSVTFLQKIKKCSSWDSVEKYGSTKHVTNHNINRAQTRRDSHAR